MMYKSLVCVMLPFCQLHCGGEGEQGPAGKDGKQGDQGPAGKAGPAGAGVTEATLGATCKTVADKNDADANKKDLAYAIAKAIIATNANGVADYTEKDNLKAALDSLNPPLAGPRGPAGSITDLGANAKAIAEYTGNAQAEKTEQEGLAKAVANSIKTVVANSDSSTYTVDKDQLATDIITLLTTKFADYQKTATLAADIKAATGADLQNIAEAVTKAIKDIEANGSSIYGGGGTGTKHDLKTALTSLVTVGGTMDAAELATAIDATNAQLQTAIMAVITAIATGGSTDLTNAIVAADSGDPFVKTAAMTTAINNALMAYTATTDIPTTFCTVHGATKNENLIVQDDTLVNAAFCTKYGTRTTVASSNYSCQTDTVAAAGATGRTEVCT